MGETPQVVALDDRSIRKLGAEMARRALDMAPLGLAQATDGLEAARDRFAAEACPPWSRDGSGATGGADVVAFLDDARALRWVPVNDVPDVPDGWRPLLVGPPVDRRAAAARRTRP